ncbi:MAG TPA: hypothetical protein VN841_06225 [Bryobacteraceae bacterium]|nr:hypothetical protein [Bryobacteraceae bacterium]
MRQRFVSVAAVLAACSLPMVGQTSPAQSPVAAKPAPAVKSKAYTPPKTPWGDPDLQGNWPAQFNIPRSRPENVKDTVLSDEEVAQKEAQAEAQYRARQTAERNGVTIGPPANFNEIAKAHKQASLVIDPPDGRMPPLTPQARAILQAERGGRGPGQHFPDKVDSWVDFDFYSRCISRGFPSTMLYTLYDYGNEIIQAPGYVVIRSEMVHETRVIPTDGRSHVGSGIKTYMGNSVGHWEGNTLVVETTNLRPEAAAGGRYTDAAKVTERFTRTAPDELIWEATINDPNVWTKPYTLRYPYKLDPEYKLYEYACHEGNYMMLDSLKGARLLEAQGLDTTVVRQPGSPGN